MPLFGSYSRLRIMLALLVVIIVITSLGISSYYLNLPPEKAGLEGGAPDLPPLSLARGETYVFDLNITYLSQFPAGGTQSPPKGTNGMVFLVSKPQNTPALVDKYSLKLGFDLNYSLFSDTGLYLLVSEPFDPGQAVIYGSPFPLPESAGRVSVVSLELSVLGLYRIQIQNIGAATVVGLWTLIIQDNLFRRPQYAYGMNAFYLAVIVALGSPLAFYADRRRSHSPSSSSTSS